MVYKIRNRSFSNARWKHIGNLLIWSWFTKLNKYSFKTNEFNENFDEKTSAKYEEEKKYNEMHFNFDVYHTHLTWILSPYKNDDLKRKIWAVSLSLLKIITIKEILLRGKIRLTLAICIIRSPLFQSFNSVYFSFPMNNINTIDSFVFLKVLSWST